MDHSLARNKRRDLLQLIGYIVALYVTWSLCRFLLLPYLEHFFTSGIMQGIIEVIVEFVIFVPPVLLYLRAEGVSSVWAYLKLNTLGKGFFWCVLCMVALFEMAIATVAQTHHHINVPYLLRADNILLTLLVGFIEEVPFRGFLLQKLQPLLGSWGAILLSSLLFAGIHIPLWLQYPPAAPLPIAFAGITLLGAIYGIVFKKTNTLWSVILIHSCYDLAVTLVTSALR